MTPGDLGWFAMTGRKTQSTTLRQAAWALALLAALTAIAAPVPAYADFRLCNVTPARIGVAIGHKDGDTWVSEGWWNLQAQSCETLIRGPLAARFYYIYAVDYDQGGEWSGKAYLCTRDREFTIRGLQDCLARGFNRTGFFEVDTGEQKNWTVQLTEQTQTPATAPRTSRMPAPDQKGLDKGQAKTGMGGR